jgi:hypothetical protein
VTLDDLLAQRLAEPAVAGAPAKPVHQARIALFAKAFADSAGLAQRPSQPV